MSCASASISPGNASKSATRRSARPNSGRSIDALGFSGSRQEFAGLFADAQRIFQRLICVLRVAYRPGETLAISLLFRYLRQTQIDLGQQFRRADGTGKRLLILVAG